MGMLHRGCVALVVLAGVLRPGPVVGQAPARPAQDSTRDQVREYYAELSEVRARLMGLYARVFEENPGLTERSQALEASLAEAMVQVDPETPGRRARLAELEDAYNAALIRGDEVGLEAMLAEGRELRRALRTARIEAGRRPAMIREVEAFKTELDARLAEVDPGALELVDRDDRLVGAIWLATLDRR